MGCVLAWPKFHGGAKIRQNTGQIVLARLIFGLACLGLYPNTPLVAVTMQSKTNSKQKKCKPNPIQSLFLRDSTTRGFFFGDSTRLLVHYREPPEWAWINICHLRLSPIHSLETTGTWAGCSTFLSFVYLFIFLSREVGEYYISFKIKSIFAGDSSTT